METFRKAPSICYTTLSESDATVAGPGDRRRHRCTATPRRTRRGSRQHATYRHGGETQNGESLRDASWLGRVGRAQTLWPGVSTRRLDQASRLAQKCARRRRRPVAARDAMIQPAPEGPPHPVPCEAVHPRGLSTREEGAHTRIAPVCGLASACADCRQRHVDSYLSLSRLLISRISAHLTAHAYLRLSPRMRRGARPAQPMLSP